MMHIFSTRHIKSDILNLEKFSSPFIVSAWKALTRSYSKKSPIVVHGRDSHTSLNEG